MMNSKMIDMGVCKFTLNVCKLQKIKTLITKYAKCIQLFYHGSH